MHGAGPEDDSEGAGDVCFCHDVSVTESLERKDEQDPFGHTSDVYAELCRRQVRQKRMALHCHGAAWCT